MWYEILPTFGIIMGVLAVPALVGHYSHKFFLGNTYQRSLKNKDQRRMYLRDERITNFNVYQPKGLDNIPD